jgi:hypothetical protein
VRCREDSISADWGKDERTAQAELDRDILRHLRCRETPKERVAAVEDAVFLKLRRLYQFDPETAVRLHQETFPGGYAPSTDGGNTAAYCTAYRVMGFPAAERLKTLLQKVRS